MSDFTTLIMRADNSHDLPAQKEPGRWRQGEIVDVFPLAQCPGPAGHPKHLHVQVTGCPASFEQIKQRLTTPHYKDLAEDTPEARRKFVMDFSAMTTAHRKSMLRDAQVALTWPEFREYVKFRKDFMRDLGRALTDVDIR